MPAFSFFKDPSILHNQNLASTTMAMHSSSLLILFLISTTLLLLPCFITSDSITIPLSHFHNINPHHPYHHLNNLATSSLTRARHLKNPHTTPTTTTPIFPQSYGGYSIHLSFGTPPQTLPFLVDTGSDMVWFPCTKRYQCKDCSHIKPHQKLQTFIPELSSSAHRLRCLDPKCNWIHQNNSCNSPTCPQYIFAYGDGLTIGDPLSETLILPTRPVPDFLVGCSVHATSQPDAGIAGMGRGPMSLPSQLGLKKFSYCVLSRTFDDTYKSTSLVLDGEKDSGQKTAGLNYTPFLNYPVVPGLEVFKAYYYVGLRKITVGGRRVKIPYRYLKPDSNGNGGTIVDSGSTFTVMAREVFERVSREFIRHGERRGYKRVKAAEDMSKLRPCFNVSGTDKTTAFPEMRFHFKGGADVALPPENQYVDGGDVICMALMNADDAFSSGNGTELASSGPSIVLGSFQMQNFYLEYDVRNQRLGFRQQKCN